jgi:mRNA interferase MazF
MTLNRGDVGMARFPHAGGTRGKRRPVVVVQANAYNHKLRHFIVAEVTTNLAAANDPTCLLIDVATPDGKASALDRDSVIGCLSLATVTEDRITKVLGKLSPTLQRKLDDCPKIALELL